MRAVLKTRRLDTGGRLRSESLGIVCGERFGASRGTRFRLQIGVRQVSVERVVRRNCAEIILESQWLQDPCVLCVDAEGYRPISRSNRWSVLRVIPAR